MWTTRQRYFFRENDIHFNNLYAQQSCINYFMKSLRNYIRNICATICMCEVKKYIRKFIMVLFIQLMEDVILEIICNYKTVKLFFCFFVFPEQKFYWVKYWRRNVGEDQVTLYQQSYTGVESKLKLYWGGK